MARVSGALVNSAGPLAVEPADGKAEQPDVRQKRVGVPNGASGNQLEHDNEDAERQFKTIITKLDQLTVSVNRLVENMAENKIDSKVENKPIAVAKKVIVKKPSTTKKATVKKTKKS